VHLSPLTRDDVKENGETVWPRTDLGAAKDVGSSICLGGAVMFFASCGIYLDELPQHPRCHPFSRVSRELLDEPASGKAGKKN
jgi:hypothetical protein